MIMLLQSVAAFVGLFRKKIKCPWNVLFAWPQPEPGPAACSGSAEVKHDNKINKWENKKGWDSQSETRQQLRIAPREDRTPGTILPPLTGAWKTFQPQWRWDNITPTNLIPTNTGELGLGGPANIWWQTFAQWPKSQVKRFIILDFHPKFAL